MPDLPKYPVRGPENLIRQIKAAFPELKWRTTTYIDEGWDHEVILLDHNYVFRFPNDDFYANHLRSEIAVLEQLGPLVAVQIPAYSHVAADAGFAGYPFIQGLPLRKDAFADLTRKDRAEFARQLAGLLSVMHALTGADLAFIPVEDADLQETHDEVAALAFRQLPAVLGRADMGLVEEIVTDTEALLAEEHSAVLIHGDIYHAHLLWNGSTSQLGVIDFSDMNRGDPAFDFAELYPYGSDFVQLVYDFYTGPKDETFLRRAWRYQRWVSVYMMTDHFVYGKTSFDVARETFDWVKTGLTS